jgi:hypothetical protein
MRYLTAALLAVLMLWGIASAGDGDAMEQENDNGRQASKFDVSGLPVYQGPLYRSLDSMPGDVTKGPQFHSFHHRGVDEVGYSPLTLDDFRFPVVKRTMKEFDLEREYYPEHSRVVWHDDCNGYTVTAFFFTRDMVRDHIQRLIDEYYICDEAVAQQLIDYYAEVTPQCGEAISWVWFAVDENAKHHYADKRENRYFMRYLANFKDKFYLEFGDRKAQKIVDNEVHDFLYQYQDRGKHECGPEFKDVKGCATCGGTHKCSSCGGGGCSKCGGCGSCGTCCPEAWTKPGDEMLLCTDMQYKGFTLDPNQHYLYYPRKVVIEDLTYDGVAQAYRWKFAWRFDNCEADFLRQMCAYGRNNQMALVLSDPTWYGYKQLDTPLVRDILASADPQSFGNVWPAGNIPYDMSCCNCPYPYCDGNCTPQPEVGFEPRQEPTTPEVITPPDQPQMPEQPEEPQEPEQPIETVGKG